MSRTPRSSRIVGFGLLGLGALGALTACVVGGYDGGGVGYVGGIYEPFGYEYGGWAPGYRVGPPHGDYHGPDRGGFHGGPERGGGRPAPSIPSGARGGGGHGGGGHGH